MIRKLGLDIDQPGAAWRACVAWWLIVLVVMFAAWMR